jgi:putative NADH-flavin reductase
MLFKNNKMRIALIGASGFVGTAITVEALSREHYMAAIMRHPENLKIQHIRLTILKGDVLNEDVSKLLIGQDVVVNAYNPGWSDPDIYHDFIKGSESIINATKKAGVKRFVMVGGAGSLYISKNKQLVDSPDFPPEWKQGALALRAVLNLLKNEHDLVWTYLSPAITLEGGEKTGNFKIGTNYPIFSEEGISRIKVGDLAVALVNELEDPRFKNSRFTIGY